MNQLSSRRTFIAKYVAPVLWIGGIGSLAVILLLHPQVATNAPGSRWSLLIAWLGGGVLVVRHAVRLKRVRVDGDFLLISNYFHETRVPINTLVDVQQGGGFDDTVTLEFQDPNPFKGAVAFIPARPRGLMVWRDNRVVSELRQLAHLASED